MNNADKPAYPVSFEQTGGLTKREYVAALAMQTCIACGGYNKLEYLANDAVKYADALLFELENTQ